LPRSSAATSISTKEILWYFPFPIAVAAIQQLISATCSRAGATFTTAPSPESRCVVARRNAYIIAPVAASMVISLVAYRWSLLSASVSFTCIVKTLAPLFTIIFSYTVANEPTPLSRCASVIPVVIGVALTSATEVEFSVQGALAALIATAFQALQMVLAKRLLSKGGWSKGDLFFHVAVFGFAILLAMVLLFESRDLYIALSRPGRGRRTTRSALGWLLLNGNHYIYIYISVNRPERYTLTPRSSLLARPPHNKTPLARFQRLASLR